MFTDIETFIYVIMYLSYANICLKIYAYMWIRVYVYTSTHIYGNIL